MPEFLTTPSPNRGGALPSPKPSGQTAKRPGACLQCHPQGPGARSAVSAVLSLDAYAADATSPPGMHSQSRTRPEGGRAHLPLPPQLTTTTTAPLQYGVLHCPLPPSLLCPPPLACRETITRHGSSGPQPEMAV
jgi:hypothetical protein